MDIQCVAVRPLLDEDEMPGVLLVDEQFIAEAERLSLRACDQLALQGKHGIHGFGMDEILGDHFQHVGTCRRALQDSASAWPAPILVNAILRPY